MSIEIQQNDESPVTLLHRDFSTQVQVTSLLAIVQSMTALLINPSRDAETIPGARPTPGEARLAAEATLIKTCARLDRLVDDSRRWNNEYQVALEKQIEQTQREARKTMLAQQKVLVADEARARAHKAALEEIQSPHAHYRPTLYPINDGSWLALVGDPTDLEKGIGGVGDSPGEALKDFDRAFHGQPSHRWKQLLKDANDEPKTDLDKDRDRSSDNPS